MSDDLISRSVLVTGIPRDVDALEFISTSLKQAGVNKTYQSVSVTPSQAKETSPQYVVLLPSLMGKTSLHIILTCMRKSCFPSTVRLLNVL